MIKIQDPKDISDFQFKQAGTRHVCENFQNIPFACNLIATDLRRGLIYVGNSNNLTVLKCDSKSSGDWKLEHNLPQQITRLSLSCDYSYFAVTFSRSSAQIYNANSLTKDSLELLHEIQLSSFNQNVFAYDLRWNPAVPGMFCTVASDHCISSFSVKMEQRGTVGLVGMENFKTIKAMCVAWSPKGKQLAVGCKDGNIIQLKPELKVVRMINGPSPNLGEVIAILWLSNFQFCAAYSDKNERRISVMIVDAPKGEANGIFTCYDDITYGMPQMQGDYSPRYYFKHVPEWGLIIAASSSSTEIGLLGTRDNGVNWVQWQLTDEGRAQLPLEKTIETYPVGLTIDKTPEVTLPWGEGFLAQPVPILHIFGTSGKISSFHMVNLTANSPPLCSPPSEPLTILPQPRVSLLPTEISFNFNSNATSTPRPKQDLPIEKPKSVAVSNLFSEVPKQSSPAPAPQINQNLTPAPAPQYELKIPKPQEKKVEIPPPKMRLSPVKETTTAPLLPEKPPVDDTICLKAFREEQMQFEKELRSKIETQFAECGTEEERQKLGDQSAKVEKFLGELQETTSSLAGDISYLKGLLLQSFAWVEETKSRNSSNSSDNSRDRHDRSKVKELQRLFFHTQNQLIQAMKALDMEWFEYETREKAKIKIPNLEFIYQSLKKQSEIITREKSLIETYMKKWKALTNGNSVLSLNQSMSKMNLSKVPSTGNSKINGEVGIIEMRCRTIANNTKSFSREKQMKLRELMLQTKPRVIKAINPSPVQDRLEAILSSLASLNPVKSQPKTKPTKSLLERTGGAAELPISFPQKSPINANPTKFTTQSSPTQVPAVPKSNEIHNPLASLNNIVSKLGSSSEPLATTGQARRSVSVTPASSSTFSSTFANTEKPILTMPFTVKNLSQSSVQTPVQTPTSTAFSKNLSISFGPAESSKHQENSASKDPQPKTGLSFGLKETIPNAQNSSNSFLSGNLFKNSLPSGMTISKVEQLPATQVQSSITTSSEKDSIPVTATQQNTFSLGGALPSIAPSKSSAPAIAPTTTTTTTTSSLQSSFTFGSKTSSDQPAFSFAGTTSAPATQTSLPTSLDLSKLATGLNDKPPLIPASTSAALGKLSFMTPAINLTKTPTSTPVLQLRESIPAVSLPAGTSLEKIPPPASSTTPASSITPASSTSSPFGATTTNIFGGGNTGGLSTSIFGGVSVTPVSSTPSATFGVPQTISKNSTESSVTSTSIFGSAPTFSQSSTNATTTPLPTMGFNTMSTTNTSSMSSLNFGKPPTATAPVSSSVFDNKNSGVNLISQNTGSSVFDQQVPATMAQSNSTPSQASTFSFNRDPNTTPSSSIFGGMMSPQNTTIFGGSLAQNPPAGSMFGGNSITPASSFGAPSGGSIFGAEAAKPPENIFGATSTFGSAPAMQTPGSPSAFGGAPAFGTKPMFGSPNPVFGSLKPEFGASPFGGTTFGSPSGFGNQPTMGSPQQLGAQSMGKVFGNPVDTFGSLAGQNGALSFGSLAQNSPEKPAPAPAFSGGSSFKSWR